VVQEVRHAQTLQSIVSADGDSEHEECLYFESSYHFGEQIRHVFFDSPLEKQFWNTWCQIYSWGSFQLIPQYHIGSYRVDFAEVATKTVIEIDGEEAHSGAGAITRDRQRERAIERMGWHVVRFGGREVYHETEKCVRELMAILMMSIQGDQVAGGQSQWLETPCFVRLLPSCGCLGDTQGFMSEFLCPCGCGELMTKYHGMDGELIEASVADLNANLPSSLKGKHRFILLPGVFPMDWHSIGYTALVGKWPSVEAYRTSEEAQGSVSRGQ
jgi:very-short-patch-repair endonuclease